MPTYVQTYIPIGSKLKHLFYPFTYLHWNSTSKSRLKRYANDLFCCYEMKRSITQELNVDFLQSDGKSLNWFVHWLSFLFEKRERTNWLWYVHCGAVALHKLNYTENIVLPGRMLMYQSGLYVYNQQRSYVWAKCSHSYTCSLLQVNFAKTLNFFAPNRCVYNAYILCYIMLEWCYVCVCGIRNRLLGKSALPHSKAMGRYFGIVGNVEGIFT